MNTDTEAQRVALLDDVVTVPEVKFLNAAFSCIGAGIFSDLILGQGILHIVVPLGIGMDPKGEGPTVRSRKTESDVLELAVFFLFSDLPIGHGDPIVLHPQIEAGFHHIAIMARIDRIDAGPPGKGDPYTSHSKVARIIGWLDLPEPFCRKGGSGLDLGIHVIQPFKERKGHDQNDRPPYVAGESH